MSRKLAKNRFIVTSIDKSIGLYQQLINRVSNLQELGNILVRLAEQAQAFRQYDKVREAAQALIHLPIKQYEVVGHYYIGLCEYRKGHNPRDIFERVAEQAPLRYRVCAMQSLAAIEARQKDHASELRWRVESLKISPSVDSLLGIAIIKSREGYHQSAVKDLEGFHSFAQRGEPINYINYLNSYAVELGEVGRIEEATNVCKIVLASPFAFAYPEWRETANEIALRGYKSRSVVSLTSKRLDNVLSLPERDASDAPVYSGRARILDYLKWKKKMVKENGNDDKLPEIMTSRDMVMKLMNLTTQEGISDEKLQKILDYVEKVLSEPD